jgi:hypothetical protein
VLSTLRQEISSYLLAQSLQGIELLVEELGPTAHADFRYFVEPFRTMVRCVDGCTFTGNAPAPVERLEPIHDAREIFADRQITARQLLQRSEAVLSMVDRSEKPSA